MKRDDFMKYAKYFDHTILNPEASEAEVDSVCAEAVRYDFASVCVNQYRTAQVAKRLAGTGVITCTVVGFPLGAVSTEVKVYETECAIRDGAGEIDMVLNIGAMKDRNYDYVLKDIAAVKKACSDKAELKVIIETCLLSDEEKKKACELAVMAKADFVKTSTGFSKGGAVAGDVELMKNAVAGKAKVKASGGIRDYDTAQKMIAAGADRLGTSKTLAIISEA